MTQMNLSLSLRSQLLMGTAIDAYAVTGFKPNLVFDFDDEYYRVNNTQTSFSDSITHSASSNATMVDESGVLKWRPHNLFLQSEDISSASWLLGGNETIDADYAASPNGDITADRIQMPATSGTAISQNFGATLVTGAAYTVAFFVKATSANTNFTLYASGSTTSISSAFTATSEWQLFEYDFTAPAPASGSLFVGINNGNDSFATDILVWGAHLYRSDLGGMVDNPDTGNSYVPTTSAARYLPRRGHHVWNGSAWVNEGLLHESEARTNLALHSRDLSDAAWTKTDVTAAKTATAVTGETNGATTLTATAGNGTVTQAITSASALRVTSMWVKRRTGTGDIEMTQDNGSTWTAVTVTSGWTRVNLDAVTSTDPTVGIRIVTSGDEIDVDFFQHEVGGQPSSEIPTSGSTVTRAAETLTIPSAKLPWPTPNVIGPELVTNGTFDTDTTGWFTVNCSAVSTASEAVVTSSGSGNTIIYQDVATVSGKLYLYEADFVGTSSGSAFLSISGSSQVTMSVVGTRYSLVFRATASSTRVQLYWSAAAASETRTYDNVSFREIDPLSVSIQMQGRMTYADTNPANGIEALQVNWELDANNRIQIYNNTGSTRVGDQFFLQRNATVQDFVGGSGNYTPGINVPFNIASRHGSTFINGAVDGTALTANTTPVALPDLSATDLSLGYDYMGTIRQLRIWDQDITDAGIEEASA